MAKIDQKKYFTIITLVDLYFWKIFSQIEATAKKKKVLLAQKRQNMAKIYPKCSKSTKKLFHDNHTSILVFVSNFQSNRRTRPNFFCWSILAQKGPKIAKITKNGKTRPKNIFIDNNTC